jgi:hypothetical protein
VKGFQSCSAHAQEAYCSRPLRVFNMIASAWRRYQHHGLKRERPGLEFYTSPNATPSNLPQPSAASSRRLDFGKFTPSTNSATLHTSLFPHCRGSLVSISSRSRRIGKFLLKLRVFSAWLRLCPNAAPAHFTSSTSRILCFVTAL